MARDNVQRRLADAESIVDEILREVDPADDPLLQLSDENREFWLRHREACDRGEEIEDTPDARTQGAWAASCVS